MAVIKTFHEYDTKLCADCVAWCPIESKEDILVSTTYQLMTEGTKAGSILLFTVTYESIILQQAIVNLPGILDLKWKPKLMSDGKISLATADSHGNVIVYILKTDNIELTPVATLQVFPSSLALYVDWCPHRENLLLTSSSKGVVALLSLENGSLKCLQKWEAHKFEAWVASFDLNFPSIIYTGGDDSVMKCYDDRMSPANQVWRDTTHSAGVTSFMTSLTRPAQFASGSYDERLLLWDSRKLKSDEPLSETCLGGGVWRVKSNEKTPLAVIAACMFAGFKLLQWDLSEFSLMESYRNEEECLAYGADWSTKNIFAACSFYDHKLTICKVVQ